MNNSISIKAKKCLNASMPDRLVARTVEHQEIKNNLLESFNDDKSVSIYVNGPPGKNKSFESAQHLIITTFML